MNQQNLAVLTNIIGAVESGGQVYGKRRYDQYSPPYHSTPKEHTITIGWACCYGHEARQLIQAIKDADLATFFRLDTADIDEMLRYDWEGIKWKPNSKEKAAIIAIIDSPIGHKVQDALFEEKMQKLCADCAKDYTDDIKAQMMYCEIRHLGGKKPVNRIFDRCKGNYSLDNIMASLVADQKDTSSSNQVGDKIFWSRHVKCRQFIDAYAVEEKAVPKENKKESASMTETQAINKVLDIAKAEVGYHEKKSNSQLNSKTANAGSNNWTKYGVEMHKVQPSNMDLASAWCDMFVDWCFYKAFGADLARKVLCGNFDDYTPNSANYYKKAGRWTNTPKRGYQVFFRNSERICHTGLVYSVGNGKIYTYEGNAQNEVRKKSYALNDSYIAGYGMPKYSLATNSSNESKPAPKPEPEKLADTGVAGFQAWINSHYADLCKKYVGSLLTVDGKYGEATKKAAVTLWKYMSNKYYGSTLTLGNFNFFELCKAAAEKITLSEIKKHPTFAVILQGLLAKEGLYKGPIDGNVGILTEDALVKYKILKQLGNNTAVTAMVWYKLFN